MYFGIFSGNFNLFYPGVEISATKAQKHEEQIKNLQQQVFRPAVYLVIEEIPHLKVRYYKNKKDGIMGQKSAGF
ncbi:MAG: hypothetical protein PHF84_10695 [bacterium]|nr:hypothetical protein [bacterium]